MTEAEMQRLSREAHETWGLSYYHVMPKIIKKFDLKIGAELGVAFAGHSEFMLKKTELELLYSVDPYNIEYNNTDGYHLNGRAFTQDEYEELNTFAQVRLARFDERNKFLRMTTHEAFGYFHYNRIELDFVFIDARHRFEDIYTDIFLYKNVVRKGGILSGHDYGHESYPGIKEAVDHFYGKVNTEAGNIWWIQL